MGQRPATIEPVLSRFVPAKFLNFSLKLTLTAAALWLAFRGIQTEHLTEIWERQERLRMLEVIGLMLAQLWLGAMRWRNLMGFLDTRVQISRYVAFSIYYISIFFSCCLPGGAMSSDVVRVWLTKAHNIPLTLSIHSVVIDRILALLALIILVLVGLPWLAELMGFDARPVLALVAVLAVVGLWCLFRIERLLAPVEHMRPVRWLLHFTGSLQELVRRPFKASWLTLYAVVGHLLHCTSAYVLAQSLGIEISFWQVVLLLPPVILVSILPLSVGGWGMREACMVAMLALIGVPQSAALLLSIELGILIMVATLPASILWFFAQRQNKQQDPNGTE